MPTKRVMSISIVILTGLPWSLSLGVMGLWLIGQDHEGILSAKPIAISAGVAALTAGQLVFLMCIADRVFPRAHQTISRGIEGSLAAIFLGSSSVLAITALLGWSGS